MTGVTGPVTGPTGDAAEPARQRLATLLANRATPAAGAGPIPRRPEPEAPAPLTPIQRRLWFLWRLEPESLAYLIPLVVRLRGPVDVPALVAAVRDLVADHRVLRSVVTLRDGEPYARPVPVAAVPIEVAELDPDREPLADRVAAAVRRPFALDTEPPCRVLLLEAPGGDCVLVLTLHHLATDGRSQQLLLRELADRYAARLGLRPRPPEPAVQFADLAAWWHTQRDRAGEDAQLAWWADRLAGLPPVLALPTDRPRPARPDWSSGLLPVEPPDRLVEALRATAADTGCTPFMLLMAGLQALLSRLAGTDDVVVGMPEAGRGDPATADLLGCFLNTLVVRGDLAGDPTGRELLGRVREQVLGALTHADVPFERIVARVHPDRDLGVTPIYQVQLNLFDAPQVPRFPGLAAEVSYPPVGQAKFDLAFELTDAGPGGPLRGTLEYRTELFDPGTAARIREWYLSLLAGLLSDLDRPVAELPLAPVTGPLRSGPVRPRPVDATLPELFAQQVASRPDAVAVAAPDGVATYRELSARANRIAHRLIAAGVAADEPVAVLLEPGADLPAAILGILIAGAAYLPVDPATPQRRVAAMLDTAGARVAITERELAGRVAPRLAIRLDDPDQLAGLPDHPPAVAVGPDQLAHVIFTSGSTGEPKGVAVPHRGIVNCVTGMLERTPWLAGRSFGLVSTIAADLGLASFYGALLSGGTLHLLARETATDPAAFAGYLAAHPVDVVKLVPSHLSLLASHGELAAVLPRRLLVLGGEAVPWELVERVRAVRPELAVHTHYGPTECAMFSLVCDVDQVPPAARAELVPLGTLLPDIGLHVLDRAGRPLPAGIPGELALIGPGVSRGYLNRPALTAARFGPDPIDPARRCYRTGDLVRVHPERGTVEFLGRTDDQVKIRGHRVELAEVAIACRAHPAVEDAYVLPVGEGHERRLAGWLAAPSGVDEAELRARLRETLPDYLVPASLTVLDRLPLTPNGKVDRTALPQPGPDRAPERRPVPPRTATEAAVAAAWCEVLGLAEVGVEDDFFALGGHSFAATRVVGRLRRELHREVPLRLLFERPRLADLAAVLAAELAAGPDRRRTGPDPAGPIPRRPPGQPALLSSVQARLWFLAQLEPDSSAYHIPLLLRLPAELDQPALAGAVRDLADRHEVLRSVIVERDGGRYAQPLPTGAVSLAVVETTEPELAAAARAAARRPFRLDREPPLRAVLFRTGDGYALGLTLHHIAADAWSIDQTGLELAALYTARRTGTPPPPPPPVQYADYAAWLGTGENPARAQSAVDWWVERLAGAPPALDLPTDRPCPPVASGAGATVPAGLPAPLVARLRELAGQTGCTPFMILLATWQAFLGRLADTVDVVVGVPESGRRHPDTERVIGCFINPLAIRTDLSGRPTGRELLARVRAGALDAFARADAPFERVVERLAPVRDPSRTPLFQVLLNVLEDGDRVPSFPGLATEVLARPEPASKYDLTLTLVATGGGYQGGLTFRTDLFDPDTIRRWAGWFRSMLAAVLADPDRPIDEIPLQPVAGPLLAGPPVDRPASEPPFRAVERWADRRPDALAVVGPERRLSYRELDRRANQVAHALAAAGVARQEPVGVLLEPGADLVVALLGIHKAGAGYLPFDASHPDARIAAMCAAAGARVVLTNTEFAARTGGRALALDRPGGWDGVPDHRPDRPVAGTDLAHIVFTSGSTGVPKGVAVEHRSLAHYLAGALPRLGRELAGGSYAMVSTPAADLGLTAIFAPLTTGGVAHVLAREVATDPTAFARYLLEHPVDVLKLVPSHLELLAAHGDLAAVLPRRLLILTGEALAWDLVERVRAVRPGLAIQNHYGHTETTLSSLICQVDEVPPERRQGHVPLGRPLPGVRGYLADRAGRPVPRGVPGELWLAGPGISRGYVGDPDLTARRFVPDPVDGTTRCYRSGDLLLVRPDGTVEYRGRSDDQVKVRGHRVELGEVVATLRSLPGVADAVVLPVGEHHRRTLAAWFVPRPGAAPEPDPAGLRAALRERLPDHQVPTAIMRLDRLPLNPNGKIDRAALPRPELTAGGGEPPATPTEHRIAEVWRRVLGASRVGRDDDFFALGGDSFAAVRAVRAIDPALRVIDLFTHPTLRDLAGQLDTRADPAGGTGPGGLLHRLTRAPAPPGDAGADPAALTLVCIPYGGGSAAAFQPLATELASTAPEVAVLAVELPGHDPARPTEPLRALPELVTALAAELAEAGTGPVLLYGHCVGTALALALARQLEADGHPVAGVVLAGAFPSARLPGRVPAFVNRAFGTDRWASNRTFRDALRAMGGLLDDLDEATTRTMLDSMRHDSREARAWFTRELANPGPRLRAPVLCLVGERDQVTEFYQERHQEWGAFAERVGLAVVPRAGHYFLRHQAAVVATVITRAVAGWRAGRVPARIDPGQVPVTGTAARASLRSFYLLATGQLVALVGWALSNFALGFWAFQGSGRVTHYALVVMLALVPTALLSPLGGAVADRFDRRTVMMTSYLISALVMAALVALLATDALSLWSVSVIVGITSVLTAFHQPAFLAAIAQLVPKPYLPQANAVAQLGFSVSQLAAPVAGGALIAVFGLAPVVALNVLAFGLGFATLLAVRIPDRMFRRLEEPFRSAIAGGWRFIVRRRPLLIMIGYFAVVNFFTAIMWVSVAPLVLPTAGATALGVVTAVGWIGAILGGVAVVPWGGTRRRTIGMLAFTVGSGMGMVLMGLQPALGVIAAGFALRLASMTIINVHWLALIQVKVGHELQGRVLATNLMLALSMQPIGFLIAGPLADQVLGPLVAEGGALAGTVGRVIGVGPGRGMALLLVCAGLLLTAWGVLGFCYRPMRLLEDDLPDAVPAAEIDKDLDLVQAEADRRLEPTMPDRPAPGPGTPPAPGVSPDAAPAADRPDRAPVPGR
jgi:amino acid adenylation domain-containing protein